MEDVAAGREHVRPAGEDGCCGCCVSCACCGSCCWSCRECVVVVVVVVVVVGRGGESGGGGSGGSSVASGRECVVGGNDGEVDALHAYRAVVSAPDGPWTGGHGGRAG